MNRFRHRRAALWLLLAAALFMRAFLPQGYMPARGAGGSITVRVCGSGHVLQIPLGKGEAPNRTERAEPPCAFAGLGSPGLPPPAIVELVAPVRTADSFARVSLQASGDTARVHLPPVRGPPLPA